MKLSGDFKFVATEKSESKGGKPYYVMSVLQGMDTTRIFINEKMYTDVCSYPAFCDVRCELSISMTPRGTFVSCDEVYMLPDDLKKPDDKKKVS